MVIDEGGIQKFRNCIAKRIWPALRSRLARKNLAQADEFAFCLIPFGLFNLRYCAAVLEIARLAQSTISNLLLFATTKAFQFSLLQHYRNIQEKKFHAIKVAAKRSYVKPCGDKMNFLLR